MAWIPVKERLPEPHVDVLVAIRMDIDDDRLHVYMAAMVPQWRLTLDESEGALAIEPTHWMPLPAPPEFEGS